MDDRRQRSRHHTELQLEVFDYHNGECLGRVVDLSADGFMLFSETPVSADSVWDLRLRSAQPVVVPRSRASTAGRATSTGGNSGGRVGALALGAGAIRVA